jgi:hypothetical protein
MPSIVAADRLARLELPEPPSREEYLAAKARAMMHAIRSLGVELEAVEEAMLDGYGERDFAADCGVMERYRASLPPDRRVRSQHGLMRERYRELEDRGIDPWTD